MLYSRVYLHPQQYRDSNITVNNNNSATLTETNSPRQVQTAETSPEQLVTGKQFSLFTAAASDWLPGNFCYVKQCGILANGEVGYRHQAACLGIGLASSGPTGGVL